MSIKILKFDGTSVGSPVGLNNLREIVRQNYNQREPLVVVVSALDGVDDLLENYAKAAAHDGAIPEIAFAALKKRHEELFQDEMQSIAVRERFENYFTELYDVLRGISLVQECSPRTLDYVSSFGVRLAVLLVGEFLSRRNLVTEQVDARQLIVTDDHHGDAHVSWEPTIANIQNLVIKPHIYLVTGLIAATPKGNTTTLGNGGSDLTAALFGNALNASQIEIWTKGDGFMSADPRLVKNSFVLPTVSYEEAMELSYFGAKVVHPQTLLPAMKSHIPIFIKNTFSPQNFGTVISGERGDQRFPVKGIASFNGVSLINVQGGGMVGVPGIAGRLFGALAQQGISIILITQASSEHSICFMLQTHQVETAMQAIRGEFTPEFEAGKIDRIECKPDLAIIAAVGENMAGTPGIAGKLFHALGQNSINVIAIAQGSSERNVSLVVTEQEAARAVNVIHTAFYLSRFISNLFFVGAGAVGKTLLRQLGERKNGLAETNGLILNICGIANSRRMIIAEKGIDLDTWQEQLDHSTTAFSMPRLLQRIKELKLINTILVDVTASDDIASCYADFMAAGVHIVTPNKKANTMQQAYYNRLQHLSQNHRVHYYYETTVGAGLPLINTIKNLLISGDRILKIEGILSGTLSYLFNTLSKERVFSAVIRDAHEKGLTEPDPREDLCGMDVGRKLLILAREIGLKMELHQVKVHSLIPDALRQCDQDTFWKRLPELDAGYEEKRFAADLRGNVLRYVAELDHTRCYVVTKEIPKTHPLAQAGAMDNIITITSLRYNESPLIVRGPGAGLEVTAGGLFADIVSLSYHLT